MITPIPGIVFRFLIRSLERDPVLVERIKNLKTIPGIGVITALTWALEMDDVSRFRSVKQAISYCGLCGDERSSADKVLRTPISKQRNKHIQSVLVEAAKFAPLEQFCLSPQCGFASTEEGNILAEEEQWAKLRTIVDVAGEMWGR